MDTDIEIKLKGFKALMKNLGELDTEKFIALIIKEKFDYTKWQKQLFPDMDTKTISQQAMNFRYKSKNK